MVTITVIDSRIEDVNEQSKSFVVTEVEIKAFEWDTEDLFDWIETKVRGKIDKCINSVVRNVTEKQSKEDLVIAADLKSVKEIKAEIEAEKEA